LFQRKMNGILPRKRREIAVGILMVHRHKIAGFWTRKSSACKEIYQTNH
jgi:hypothetical protein